MVENPEMGFLMLRLIYQSHDNFCDPVLFPSYYLIILNGRQIMFKTFCEHRDHVYSVTDIHVLPVPI